MVFNIVQVLDALDFGDAVSNQAIRIHQGLIERGWSSDIYSKYFDQRVADYRKDLVDLKINEYTLLVYHFSGYSSIYAEAICCLKIPVICIYHNVTPYSFFKPESELFFHCKKGVDQFQEIVSTFDLVLGDSEFNATQAQEMGAKCVDVLPIIVPSSVMLPLDSSDVPKSEDGHCKNWLFVGRIAPNKRQDLLVKVFKQYLDKYPDANHILHLVGRYTTNDPYYIQVRNLVDSLDLDEKVIFTGKVSDTELQDSYANADLFLCLSEHEGFCVPLVEAFQSQIPVVAYASTAVAENVANAEGTLYSLEVDECVSTINRVFSCPEIRQRLVTYGLEQSKKFTPEKVLDHFESIIGNKFACSGYRNHEVKVSVIICTFNRVEHLKRCLSYLNSQTYPHFEVIVVDGPSTDGTWEFLKTLEKVKIVRNEKRNLSVSRNLGIRYSSGEIVAFIDDDALPYSDWLENIINQYLHFPTALGKIGGVGGKVYFANQLLFQFEAGVSDTFGSASHVNETDPKLYTKGYFRYLMGTNSSFDRKTLIQQGGFDEQYDYYLDETDLAIRLQKSGYGLSYAENAYVRHDFAQSHNRKGKYQFNWFTICKNTVYFGVKNSSDLIAENKLKVFRPLKLILRERVTSFLYAAYKGELSIADAIGLSFSALTGALRGYYDSAFPRKLPDDLDVKSEFLGYLGNADRSTLENRGECDLQTAKERLNKHRGMHILILSKEFPPYSFGGVGKYNETLAKELIQLGHAVTVITQGAHDEVQTVGRFVCIRISDNSPLNTSITEDKPILSKNIVWAAKALSVVRDIHQQHAIDIIESALWDFESIGVLAFQDELNIPVVLRLVTPLATAIRMNGWKLNSDLESCLFCEEQLIQNADKVVAISNSIRENVLKEYQIQSDSRWSVQHLGVQPWPAFTNVSNYGELPKDLKRGKIQLLFLGRLERRKGIDIFLNALKIVLPQKPEISVWICGRDVDGWESMSANILDVKSLSRVQFLGLVSEERKELLYANCDVLVFPSQYESFGLVPLEAMVHGKPVIAAKAGAIPEVVLDDACGLLFEAGNATELSDKIVALTGNKELYMRLSEGAKRRVNELSARSMAQSSCQLYNELLSSNVIVKNVAPDIKSLIKRSTNANLISVSDEEEDNSSVEEIAASISVSLESEPTSLPKAIQTTTLRSIEWNLNYPRITGWRFLNPLFNKFIVPKLVQFIKSVLDASIQRQSALNQSLLSDIAAIKQHISRIDGIGAESNDQLLLSDSQAISGIQAKLGAVKLKVQSPKDEYRKIIVMDERITTIESNLNELKASITEAVYLAKQVQSVVQREAEFTRSELKFLLTMNNSAGRAADSATVPQAMEPKVKLETIPDGCRINIGCGLVLLDDYINVDQRELPGVDIVASVYNLPFQESSVSEIYTAHLVEHFTEFELRTKLLPYWHSLLNESGALTIICPDSEAMIHGYVKGDVSWEALREVTYGTQDYTGNYHFNMYTISSLSKLLADIGFKRVELIGSSRKNGICYEFELLAYKNSTDDSK